jgi:hypothetical protein
VNAFQTAQRLACQRYERLAYSGATHLQCAASLMFRVPLYFAYFGSAHCGRLNPLSGLNAVISPEWRSIASGLTGAVREKKPARSSGT